MKQIRVLLLEDDEDDILLMKDFLGKGRHGSISFRLTQLANLEEGLKLLSREKVDIVLLDLTLPDSHGLSGLIRIREAEPEMPIIVLTGVDDTALALSAMGEGAQDYLTKGALTGPLLARSIVYAIERSQLLIRLQQSQEERFRSEIVKHIKIDKLKDEFITTVSHELRTPLTILQGSIANLRDGLLGEMTAGQKRMVTIASRNIDRLSRLINDLLDLSRFESGKSKLNLQKVDLRAIISEMVQNFQGEAKEKGIVLEEKLPSLPPMRLDVGMIEQILMNLLSNALRFANSRVSVLAKAVHAGMKEQVQISIIDDGPGIPADDIDKLFNKFEQINRPVGGAGYKGTGLGLAICREIIHLHQGRIWAESVPGSGAQFHFILNQDIIIPTKSGGENHEKDTHHR